MSPILGQDQCLLRLQLQIRPISSTKPATEATTNSTARSRSRYHTPPPDTSSDQPFFHELPSGSTPYQTQPAPLPSNATTVQNPQAPQPTKGTKKVAIAASVGIVTLGMLSGLAFYLYRHRVKHPSKSQKLVNGGVPSSQRFADDPRVPPSSFLYTGMQSEVLSECINDSTLDTRVPDQFPQNVEPEMWLVELHEELERQGISLPERIDEEELRRFYTAANGDFSCMLSSVKKTIHWKETYGILSIQELEMWSNMVFWHGFDVKHRPCLVVRLGLACTSLPSHDRPRFAQAIISQVGHGVYHLLDAANAQITVVVDCEGLSPLKKQLRQPQ